MRALLSVMFTTSMAAAAPAKPIVIKAARMFDGKSDAIISPGVVVIKDGKIVAAGPKATEPAGADVALDATVFAKKTLLAGFTTVRDLGSSDFIDVGLRNSIAKGSIPGPRML